MIVWASLGTFLDIREPLVSGLSPLDVGILILAAFAVVGLGWKAVSDARQVAMEENTVLSQASQTQASVVAATTDVAEISPSLV
jgi:hypothetical protein